MLLDTKGGESSITIQKSPISSLRQFRKKKGGNWGQWGASGNSKYTLEAWGGGGGRENFRTAKRPAKGESTRTDRHRGESKRT